MGKKIKLIDAANDLNISIEEIIVFFAKKCDKKKKNTSILTENDMNLILEHWTKITEVKNFNDYYASKNTPYTIIEKNKSEMKIKPRIAVKKTEFKLESEKEKTSGNKTHDKKAKQVKVRKPSFSVPNFSISKVLTVNNIQQPRSTVVNTRGSNHINLDKYNERYDQIASYSNNNKKNRNQADYSSNKQKINYKSTKKRPRYFSNKESETNKLKRLELERARRQPLKICISDIITVGELAARLKVTAADVINKLIGLGIIGSITQKIDFDTALLIAKEFGAKVEKKVIVTIEERLINDSDDDSTNLFTRCPVVVIMGHVDHGKTSILDSIRNTNVTSSETGGITQHIGAYQVDINGQKITFIDTPGHEAFTSMRARGANITDIVILVVAADDGIMPQTVESINHAKSAGIKIIVAINKIDKEGANPDRIKEELTKYDLVCEEWGGDIICVLVSAKTGEGINDLLENILLVAEIQDLKANPKRLAKGAVIEARIDKGNGPIATLLVQNGTLHQGDILIAGVTLGRIRRMTNDKGITVKSAGPSVPVEITGLSEVPNAGDTFNAVDNEKLARELVDQRKYKVKLEQFTAYRKVNLDTLFDRIIDGEIKKFSIIVKADTQGSIEAINHALENLSTNEVKVIIIHSAVGAINDSDIMLASASNSIIVGFNVRPDPTASEKAAKDGIDIRLYNIIYHAIKEISNAMHGMLAPKYRDVELGRAEVRQIYNISNIGIVAGSYILNGKLTRNCQIRIIRDGIIIFYDKIVGLKRFKNDVKEVIEGYECGISLEKFKDIKKNDIFECYTVEKYI